MAHHCHAGRDPVHSGRPEPFLVFVIHDAAGAGAMQAAVEGEEQLSQTEETDGDRSRQREGWPATGDDPKPYRIADAMSNRAN